MTSVTLTMPNLPGSTPNKSTWAYRQQDGFGRVFQLTRPNSATLVKVPHSTTTFEVQYGKTVNQFEGEEFAHKTRPATAGISRNYESTKKLKEISQSRPSTAGTGASHFSTLQFPNGRTDLGESSQHVHVPRFVEFDKKICRFHAHFFQDRNWERDCPLGDPVIETKIPRLLTVLFHLVDSTIEITEPRQVNSGIQGGIFFRRGKLRNDVNNALLSLNDILVGSSIKVLGQEVFITDADSFTREYFKNELDIVLNKDVGRPSEMRKELGAQFATGLGATSSMLIKNAHGTKSTNYMETRDELDKTNLFFRYDGRVLRFLCVEVQSQYPPYFPHLYENDSTLNKNKIYASDSAKKFALSYYLSDKKIELVIQRKEPMNERVQYGSYDEPKLLLKKSKLPINWREAQEGATPVYYDAPDLRCGAVLDVFGRFFLLVQCDKFTYNAYRELGINQNDVPFIKERVETVVHAIPIVGDGFLAIGSNEDTLATVYGQPKCARDEKKVLRNYHRTIRCKAILLSDNDIDASREFAVTFYMEDDTVQVNEEVKRNSGITGGTFLKRGRYMNLLPKDSNAPRFFTPSDIFLGNVVSFNGFEMQITEMDNLSLRFCENFPDEFPLSDTFKIISRIMEKTINNALNIRPIFLSKDESKSGFLSQQMFVKTLDELSLTDDLNDQELLTLLRRFKDGSKYYYHEFCDLISHVFYDNFKTDKPHASPKRHVTVFNGDFLTFMKNARARNTQWRRTLRKEPHTLQGYCTLAVFAKVFEKNGLKLENPVLFEIYKQYKVPSAVADPIFKELNKNNAVEDLYTGLHKKFERENSAGHISRVKNLRQKTLKQKILATTNNNSVSRVPSAKNLIPSLMRQSSTKTSLHSSTSTNEFMFDSIDYTTVLLDYHKLFDAIYVCDWV